RRIRTAIHRAPKRPAGRAAERVVTPSAVGVTSDSTVSVQYPNAEGFSASLRYNRPSCFSPLAFALISNIAPVL
ncbi:MAG: hypothetical protein L0229_04020, partial [Blastocatellia bacterium]|nr:hypothetical protein [Blastocatellia bacterium]